MTVEEYDRITKLIVDHIIEIPEGLNAVQLIQWLNGYAKAQDDIIELIMTLKKEVVQK